MLESIFIKILLLGAIAAILWYSAIPEPFKIILQTVLAIFAVIFLFRLL